MPLSVNRIRHEPPRGNAQWIPLEQPPERVHQKRPLLHWSFLQPQGRSLPRGSNYLIHLQLLYAHHLPLAEYVRHLAAPLLLEQPPERMYLQSLDQDSAYSCLWLLLQHSQILVVDLFFRHNDLLQR